MSVPVTTRPDAAIPIRRIEADTRPGERLHLWIKAIATVDPVEVVTIDLDGCRHSQVAASNADEFAFHARDLTGGRLALAFDPRGVQLSFAYLFDPTTVVDDGIRLLADFDGNRAPALAVGYHFRPPVGWMNDPNGIGRFDGTVHLFYQHYPHSLRWNTMHWGHAVSEDLLHWRHQPVFLFPAPALSARADGRGGAFSGSAIPGPDGQGLRVFYTEQVADRTPEQQIQLSAVSTDGLAAGPSTVVVAERPTGLDLTPDFRDPYVIKGPDGRFKMVLGSRDHAGGVVLLYDTDDPEGAGGWTFRAVLYRETRFGMTAAECPCLVPLDGPADDPATRWVLIVGLLTSRCPATGRRNLTHAIVGRFDGTAFTPEVEQELDFGTDAYAFQAFVDDDGPVGIAWLANWTEITKTIDFPTAMTLPRRLVFRDGALATPPAASVLGLRRGALDGAGLLAGSTIDLSGGAAEIELTLSEPGAAFDLAIACPGIDLGVCLDGDGLRIRYQPDGQKPAPAYLARGARPSSVRIFLDDGSIEVFADDGRWTGTKRLKDLVAPTSARLVAAPGAVTAAAAYVLGL